MKRKGIITWGDLNNKELPYFVDFKGWKEGSGTPCKNMEEVKKEIQELVAKHKENYKLEVIHNTEKDE